VLATPQISPDGKTLLATSYKSHKLQLQPVGLGQSKELPTPGLKAFDVLAWSDDGHVVAYEAQTDQNDWNVYAQRIDGGPPILVRAGGRDSVPTLSSDGEMLALHEEQGGISLYQVGGRQGAAMKGVLESEYPVRFAKGGKSLLVITPTGTEMVLTLVDLASGRREPWERIPTEARPRAWNIVVTPDLKYYAYSSPRHASDLYIVDNLH